MSSHYLIAIATSAYQNLPAADQRPQLSGVLTSIVELFTKRVGPYQRVLPGLAENPPSRTVVDELDKWFAAEERDGSDWVVLYYTGHGALPDDKTLYLLTSDFQPDLYSSTSVRFDELATMIGGDRAPGIPRKNRNILLIVDTCFAGAGAQEISNRFSTIVSRNSGGAFRVLAAALPNQEAQAGALARALIETIDELAQRHVMQEVFYLEQIAPLIKKKLRIQSVLLSITSSSDDEPRFFLNPNYVDTGGAPVAANEARKAILDSEFREHWGPRARGVEFDSQPGQYFTGRKAVLSELVSYLQGNGDARTRVVIGRPGAGKSAILAHLVTQSMPQIANRVVPKIDFALHAKGQGLNDVRIRLGNALGVEPKTEEILKKLQILPTPFRVIVDALDEAAEPKEIARELLGPMTGMANTRLVIGTRASELPTLYDTANIDIDEAEYANIEDITNYVEARLERRDEPSTPTPYRNRLDLKRAASSAVAYSAFPNFLIARLHTEYLLAHPELAKPERLAGLRLPSTVDAAFAAYLARFGYREAAVRDILLPLAWAEGQGLPWDDIWAPLASALSGRDYVDDDIKRVLEEAGAYVLESTEQGRSVYRLYHQALTDSLRKSSVKGKVDETFVDVLIGSVPQLAGSARQDWLVASQYVRKYLATHASRCFRLTPLLSDPLYLLAAEPISLLREIAGHRLVDGNAEAALYTSVVHHLRREPVATATAYLELVARQRMLGEMAREVSSLPLGQPWHVPWANWTTEPPRGELAKGQQNITALSVLSTTPDDLLAAVGREDGVVEVWNVVSGDCVRRWENPTPFPASVRRVTIAATSQGRIVVAGWTGGQLGRFNLDTGERSLVEEKPDEDSEVMAMCMAERDGEPVCITAHRDRRFYIRELTGLRPIVRAMTPTAAAIYDVRVAQYEKGNLVFTVGDYFLRGSDKKHPTVHGCSLRDLSVVWKGGDSESIADHIELATLYERTVAVISRNWKPTQIWDVAGRVLYEGQERAGIAWLPEIDGRKVLIESTIDGLTSRILEMDAATGKVTAHPAAQPPISIPGGAIGDIVSLHGRPTLVGVSSEQLHFWDLASLVMAPKVEPRLLSDGLPFTRVQSLAAPAEDSTRLYGAGSNEVVAFDTKSGAVRWRVNLSPHGAPRPIPALSNVPGAGLVVAVLEGVIYLLDAADGAIRKKIETGRQLIQGLHVSAYGGRPVAFITGRSGGDWSVSLWDLASGQQIGTKHPYALHAGEEDKPLYALAVKDGPNGVHFAFASKYSKVMVAHHRAGLRQPLPPFQEWHFTEDVGPYTHSLAFGADGDTTLLVAGGEYGGLVSWNFASGKSRGAYLKAHAGIVRQVCFARIRGRTVLVSGGDDGIVRLWTPKLEPLQKIDVGEPIIALINAGNDRLAVGGKNGVLLIDVGGCSVP